MNEHELESVSVVSGGHCEAKNVAEDPRLVAAYLWYDGYLKLPDQIAFIPIDEPFYTLGRPEREAVPGGTCDCMSVGGIPVLSNKIFRTLTRLGAEGQTADLIYRGFNKKKYDSVQEGFQRFQPSPIFNGNGNLALTAALTFPLPPVFAIHSTYNVVVPEPGTATQFHIGLSLESLRHFQQAMPRVLVAPLFRHEAT